MKKTSFETKIDFFNNLYDELYRFREEMSENENSPYFQPYERHKKAARLYQLLFLGIASFFLLLFFTILFKKTTWFYSVYLADHSFTKITLCSLCGLFSMLACTVALRIKPEKEAVYHFVDRAKKRLNQLYFQKKARFNLKNFIVFCKEYHHYHVLRQKYHDVLDKVYEAKEAALTVLEQIYLSKEVKEERHRLFNLALLEFRDNLEELIATNFLKKTNETVS